MSEHFSNSKAKGNQDQVESGQSQGQEQSSTQTSPLHLLLYGKECHRLESYSIGQISHSHKLLLVFIAKT